MNERELFELLGRMAEDHGEYEPGAGFPPTQVVPALVDGGAGLSDLLTAYAQHLGGVLLDVTGASFDAPIAARPDDPELRSVLETSFDLIGLASRRQITIDVGKDVDAAVLVDGSRQVATGGWSRVLAIARALFSEALAASALAILIYRESDLDVNLRSRVLRAMCEIERTAIALGSVRSLLVIIDAPGISIGDHCQPGLGIRYALLSDGAQRRRPLRQLAGSVQRFAQPRDKPVVLFLGAGFSASSRLPMGNALRDQTIARMCGLDPDNHTSESLAEGFYEFAASHDLLLPAERANGRADFASRLTLEHVVRIESKFFKVAIPQTIADFEEVHSRVLASGTVGESVAKLRELVARRANLVLVTVNFDELLEQPDTHLDIAVRPAEFEAITTKLKEMMGGVHPTDTRVPYLKLHGTISVPDTCVARDDQTLTGLDIAKRTALEALVKDLDGDPLLWVYVGASMRDLDLQPVFGMHEFHSKVEEYWASPYIEPSVRLFAESRAHSWTADQRLDERMITEVADQFVAELAARWPP
jgi:hypothetical protein